MHPLQSLWQQGLSTIPIEADRKAPAVAWKCFQERRVDWDTLQAWIERWPRCPEDCNVAVITGRLSRIAVLDIDDETIPSELGNGTWCGIVRTPRGWHRYYAYPPFADCVPSAVGIRTRVDLRADGGYVLAPPSRVNQLPYTWVTPFYLPTAPFLPDTYIRTAPREVRPTAIRDSTRYGLSVVWRECNRLYNAPPRTRNNVLNAVAYKIGQLVASCIDEANARAAMTEAAIAAGLEEYETRKTIESGLSAGKANPRTVNV